MKSIRRYRLRLTGVCIALCLTGCQAVDSPNRPHVPSSVAGPLTTPHHGEFCFMMPLYRHVALGTRLEIGKGHSVTIGSVSPIGVENVTVGSEHVMRSERSHRLLGDRWPPSGSDYGDRWRTAVTASGANLPAGSYDLVSEIGPIDVTRTGHLEGFRIDYVDDAGHKHHVRSDYSLLMSVDRCQDLS